MDYHLLALIEQSSDSDISSEGEYSAVIPEFQEIQTKGPLANQAKFADRIFRAGSRWSARLTGNPEHTGSVTVETTSQSTTTESVITQPIRTEVPLLPQLSPKTTKVKTGNPGVTKIYRAPEPPLQGVEFKDYYA